MRPREWRIHKALKKKCSRFVSKIKENVYDIDHNGRKDGNRPREKIINQAVMNFL